MVSRYGNLLKAWSTDEAEFRRLYGLLTDPSETFRPGLGAEIMLPLNRGLFDYTRQIDVDQEGNLSVASQGKPEPLPPTLGYLSQHFGETRWIEENILNVVRRTKGAIQPADLDQRFFKAAYRAARRRFEQRLVIPFRKELLEQEQSLYLYCVPSVKIETDIITGRLSISQGARVLCPLPKTLLIARYYRVPEIELPSLANQVIWLIMLFSSFNTIRTSKQLIELLDEWPTYTHPAYREYAKTFIETVNPCLISPRSVQALLRKGTSQ